MTDIRSEPVEVDVRDTDLIVKWADGHVTGFDFVGLRRACACAQCLELRAGGLELWPKPGDPQPLRVEDAELVGAWGLSLRWNDRHETGIYPWTTLRSWCRCDQCAGNEP